MNADELKEFRRHLISKGISSTAEEVLSDVEIETFPFESAKQRADAASTIQQRTSGAAYGKNGLLR